MDTNEASALLEWVETRFEFHPLGQLLSLHPHCLSLVHGTEGRNRAVHHSQRHVCIVATASSNPSDPLEFELNPRTDTADNNAACRQNLEAIIRAIVVYYNRTKGWILESNISLDDLFVLCDHSSDADV